MASADRLIEVFNEAMALPSDEERLRFVAEACADEPELKEQVLSLLDAHDRAGDYLKSSESLTLPAPITVEPGNRIGHYKLLQQLGEGGCGVVYMADQEEPVRRRVALKVIKLGMDTKSVIARFEAERQALALMDHPNIARVFDAGATETGRPYFVMELVRGIKITEYCDQNNLTTEQRLELFTQICHAVQHAHQKGIIHRDLKPSNILVTLHDGVPLPKVIDFGIAKATSDQRLTDKTIFTAFEQFLGTPAYMSPEQAEMSGLDIDTRSDIYSLGVLLYELLTGRTPLDAEELVRSGMNEMRRRIREDEPPRPSTRLSTMQAGALTAVAKHRQADAPKLIHLLRGDLDWIVMKCLEKDRSRRYETANGLAADLKRHLHNEPVTARPPSRVYQFQKLIRRNRLAFAAIGAVMTALVLGVVASSWQAVRATHAERSQSKLRKDAEAEKQKAQTEAAKAIAISDFLQQLLRSANPDALKGGEYTVRQLLDDFSAGLTNQFENQPEVEATVRATIGRAYYKLGAGDKAHAHFERVLTLRRQLFGNRDERVAATLVDCAWASYEQERFGTGEAQAQEALDIYREHGTTGQPLFAAFFSLQRNLVVAKRVVEVEALTQEALRLASHSPGVEFPELASMKHGLAEVRNNQSRFVEAEALALEALAMHRRLRPAGDIETGWALLELARTFVGLKKLKEAERAAREALGIFRSQYAAGHRSMNAAIDRLTTVLDAKADHAAIVELHQEVLAAQRARFGNESPVVAETLSMLSSRWYALGKTAESEKASREAMEIIFKLRNEDLAKLPSILRHLSEALKSQGKADEPEKAYQQAILITRETLGDSHPLLGELLFDCGTFLASRNKFEAAAKYHLQSLPIRRNQPDEILAWTLRNLGGELVTIGRPEEGESYLRESLEVYRRFNPQEDLSCTAWPKEKIGEALLLQKKLPEAEQAYREAVAAYEAVAPDDWRTFCVRTLLGEVLVAQRKYTAAEPFLVSGYGGLKQREDNLATYARLRMGQTAYLLVRVYSASGQTDKAAQWTKQLEAFEKVESTGRPIPRP